EHIREALHGDLDWITLKALERDRTKRYATPAELADDIQRYLDDDLVLATPPTFRYRSNKFVKRHKLAVVSAALIATGLLAVAISTTVQAVRIRRERDRANREALAARSVADFLVGLFRVSDPSEARGSQVTAREILDKGRSEIEKGLAGQPEVQARLMGTLGKEYTNLGMLNEAQPLVERAVETTTARLGAMHVDTLRLCIDLADLTNLEGKYDQAETQLARVVAHAKVTLGEKHAETLRGTRLLASVYISEGKYAQAEAVIAPALATSREIGDAQSEIGLMNNLAIVYNHNHQYDQAQKIFQEVLDLR